MRKTEFEFRALKGDRVVKTFETRTDAYKWVETRERDTHHVPLKLVQKTVEEHVLAVI